MTPRDETSSAKSHERPDASARSSAPRLSRPAVMGMLVVAAVIGLTVLLWFVVGSIAQARGGGIEAEPVGAGVASGLTCSPTLPLLRQEWTCRAETIEWDRTPQLPNKVHAQRSPYTVLATRDLTGARVEVTSHLPMGWETRQPSKPLLEVIVAQGHPVGSNTWWTVMVFVPLVVAGVGFAGWYFSSTRPIRRGSGRTPRR